MKTLFKHIFSKNNDVQDSAEVLNDSNQCESECQVSDDLELIAVITAAIAAQLGRTTDGFVVRSIRRRPSNKWI